ncbi:MAG: sugar phosphate isomerase/epimerase [Saprospiraceae bacterium]|nr:sugar phosphate isomerase/epimerase [Saprospiraceae bacterium]
MDISRKSFIQLLGASVAGGPFLANSGLTRQSSRPVADLSAHLGLASYTLLSFSLDEVIDTLKKLDIKHVALKSMHLPLESSDDEIMKLAEKVRSNGLNLYGVGVIYMKTADEVDNAFRYAKAAGVKTIIGVPNHELLPQTNDLVKKYNIKMAIHNHGPGDEMYPSPETIMKKIVNLDSRIGVCLDIGHAVRIGLDASTEARRCGNRLYDIHLKDVNVAAAEGGSVEIGRGIIDIPAFIKTLSKIKYQGVMGLEYEKDGEDPFMGLAESVGYSRAVMQMT